MAHFKGTFGEFDKLTSTYQCYKNKLSGVKAADLPLIVRQVLETNFKIGNNLYDIDLDEFEKKLIDACKTPFKTITTPTKKIKIHTITPFPKPTTVLKPLTPTTTPTHPTHTIPTPTTTLTPHETRKLELELINGYTKWMTRNYYKITTINCYIIGINKVCFNEGYTSWLDVLNNISQLINDYGPFGKKAALGEHGHNTVICALRRFKEFLDEQK